MYHLLCLVGSALNFRRIDLTLIVDGVLTPAQSVLGAIQGYFTAPFLLHLNNGLYVVARLRVVNEDISTATIVGTSCGILVLLFLIQPLGTSKIASGFAPIVVIWLIFNLAFGIYVRMSHFNGGFFFFWLTPNPRI